MRKRIVMAVAALAVLGAAPATAQGWVVTDSGKGPLAQVCDAAGRCFGMGCADGGALRSWLDVPGTRLAGHAVTLRVDGRAAGGLELSARDAGATLYVGNIDPAADAALVTALKRGLGLRIEVPVDAGDETLVLSLRGSSRALTEVFARCPLQVLPVADPGAKVLGAITAQCQALGGEVEVEPGFRRVEDLDGDGRADLVLDHAAAACSRRASLGCGPGGCTVSFWLARDGGYLRAFSGTIRGYETAPGGVLALEIDGAGCGGAGMRACVQRYDLTGDAPRLVATLTGAEAVAALDGDPPAAADRAPADRSVGPLEPVAPDAPDAAREWLGDGGPATPRAPSGSAE